MPEGNPPKIYHPFDIAQGKDANNPTAHPATDPQPPLTPKPAKNPAALTSDLPIHVDLSYGRSFSLPLFLFTLIMLTLISLGLYSYFVLQPQLRHLNFASQIKEPLRKITPTLEALDTNLILLQSFLGQELNNDILRNLRSALTESGNAMMSLEKEFNLFQTQIPLEETANSENQILLIRQRMENLIGGLQAILLDFHRVGAEVIDLRTAQKRLEEISADRLMALLQEVESLHTNLKLFNQQLDSLRIDFKIPFLN